MKAVFDAVLAGADELAYEEGADDPPVEGLPLASAKLMDSGTTSDATPASGLVSSSAAWQNGT